MSWIDAIDRLPKDGVRVLLLTSSYGVCIGTRVAAKCRWDVDGKLWLIRHDDVTHWCEIPPLGESRDQVVERIAVSFADWITSHRKSIVYGELCDMIRDAMAPAGSPGGAGEGK